MIREEKGECDLHWRYRLLADGFATNRGDAQLVFHATRGLTVRVNSCGGTESDTREFFRAVEFRARKAGATDLYVSDAESSPNLENIVSEFGFRKLEEVMMSRWTVRPGIAIEDSTGVTIRPMLVGEFTDVRARLIRLVSGGTADIPLNMVSFHASVGAYRPLVAEIDGTIVGYAENNVHFMPIDAWRTTTHARVERVVVAPEARGRRIAGLLVAGLIRDAECMGCSRVSLQVMPTNTPAVRTYEKLGFAPTSSLLFAKTLN